MKYVIKKDKQWYCRIVPKKELLPFLPIKTKEYIKKLNATTASDAESSAIPIINKWQYEIQVATKAYEETISPPINLDEPPLQRQEKELDKISPSFCLAKWGRTNLRPYEGTSYSCHHCRPIVTPKEEVVKDHTKLTNNDAVKKWIV